MLLKRLIELAEREELLNEIPKNYAKRPVHWFAEINGDGTWKGNGFVPQDKGFEMMTPYIGRSGKTPPPILLYDKASTALCLLGQEDEKKQKNIQSQHTAFIALIDACAEATKNQKVKAVGIALKSHDKPLFPKEMKATDWITFRVDDEVLIHQDDIKNFWIMHSTSNSDDKKKENDSYTCIGCGKKCSPLKRHTIDIVLPAGDRDRAKLISANDNAYFSYGLENSLIAPTCSDCEEKYGKALVYLLSNKEERNYMAFGKLVYIFWTKEKVEFSFFDLLSKPDANHVKNLFQSLQTGRQQAVEVSEFYCVALSPNKARIAVRDWIETTLHDVQKNLSRFFMHQRLKSATDFSYYGIYQLASSLYRDDKEAREKMPPNLPLMFLQHALHGKPLPLSLLTKVVQRCRAECGVTKERAVLLKLFLLQDSRFKEDDLMGLEPTLQEPAYLCGRLFATLENIQKQAVSPNATITDRYYGTASTAPASVFGYLLRNAQNHLGKLRKSKPGAYVNLSKELEESMVGLQSGFPKVLIPEEQAMFALGFYHQKAASFEKAAANQKPGEEMKI